MSSWRKCVFGCEDSNSLFNLPKEETTREGWLDFVYGDPKQKNYTKNLFICDRHFEDHCLVNKAMFQSGLCNRLILKPGSVPTIYVQAQPRPSTSLELEEEPDEKPSISAIDFAQGFAQSDATQPVGPTLFQPMPPAEVSLTPSLGSFPIMFIAGKTESKYRIKENKSVGTQLSANTLKNPVRSKAVQATATYTTSNVGVQTIKRRRTLPKKKALLAEPVVRPKKRSSVEMEEEEEEEEEEDVPVFNNSSQGSDVFNFSEPADTDTTPVYEDTKYIVFEKNLRQLFEQCPVCNSRCAVQRQRRGTFVSFTQQCSECTYIRSWQNQPVTGSTPVGDLQLSAAVYFSGESFQKMNRICKAINLQIHQLDTFRKYSRMFLEPAICHNWKLHQETCFAELRERRELPVAGEMKPHPRGPSAKMGRYTVMDLESKKIIDLQLVQSKEEGSQNLMEKKCLKRSLDHLESNSLKVDYVVTDRHSKVQKYLQNRQTVQYYDVWRLEKELSKRLDELAEKKDFLLVKKWSAAIKHHMYWAAGSSKSGEEKVAKWVSEINHIQDIHTHDDPLYPRCVHPEKKTTDSNKWFKPGSRPLLEVEKLLLNKGVLRDVPKLCSDHQTSALDAFHDVTLQFVPSNVNFSFMETKCRLFLAAMHFNENLAREQEMCGDAFLFPKSAQACPTVKTKTTFGYVRDLMRLLFNKVLNDPSSFVEDLKKKTKDEAREDGTTVT